jgi:CRP/FNR family transcriptional regulator
LGLEQAEFFRVMSPDQLSRIRHLVLRKRFERRKPLYFEGQPAEYLWVVRTGEMRLYKSSDSGRITTLEGLSRGEMFGAVSSLDQDRYTTSAEGVTDGTAWCLPRTSLLRQIAEDPRLAIELLVVTSRRLRRAHDRLRSFASDRAPVRLARALLDVTHDGEARVTRRALAEAAATTVETAIRVLRQFERDGVISGAVGRVHVEDEGALLRIAGRP